MNLAEISSSALARLCKEYHVRELYVFGSVVSGDLSPASDLDFIVKFEHDFPRGAFEQYMGFQAALEEHFGRKVDLLTLKPFRNPVFQAEVDRTKKLVYAA
jgi:predicted nucleotidyltransferase